MPTICNGHIKVEHLHVYRGLRNSLKREVCSGAAARQGRSTVP